LVSGLFYVLLKPHCGYLCGMKLNWMLKGALLAALSVALGAFAAHGLKSYVDQGLMTESQLHNFDTASRYQMYHALGILLVAVLMKLKPARFLNVAAWCFALGILFFCGSLYLLSTAQVIGLDNWRWLGPVTPLGGLFFIAGWVLLAFASLKRSSVNS
jgi:uncharacterized membrane protein YgdD (TMEM256/DUF423 family)